MKIRQLALSALLLAAVGATTAVQAAERAAAPAKGDAYQASITKIVKVVEWQRYRTSRWQKASLENLLLVGDTLRTGADAKAELQYGDGSVTRVGSLTSLTLTGDNKRELRLDSGKVWLHINKGGAGMRVITPGAVAAVTGTELLVEFDPVKKLTEVTVFEGSVNVISDVGNLVRVLGGTTTMVPLNAPAAAPVPLDTNKIQTRENIFRPLSVETDGAEPKPNQGQPEDGKTEGATSEVKPEDGKPANQVTKPADGQPAGGQEVKPEAGQQTQPTAGDAGAKPAPDAGKPGTSPDMKGHVGQMNDPRIINGSPTTGTIRVIIE